MKLIYTATQTPVCIGDNVTLARGGETVKIVHFDKPHKPESQGKVTVMYDDGPGGFEYYVSVIGAAWIEREDRA